MDSLSPKQDFGPYHILKKIGSGGMGEVYLAYDKNSEREVALKVLPPSFNKNSEITSRFHTEGRALAKIQHPNIVTLYSTGTINNLAYIAMEYAKGVPLDLFFVQYTYKTEFILHVAKQLAAGMQAVHENGIIHRDLKPQNIIIDPQTGQLKVIDFGIVKSFTLENTVDTQMGTVMGTANYLSPEIAMGRPATNQSDIYGLGVILYEMIVGEVPFKGDNVLAILEKVKSASVRLPPIDNTSIPYALRHLVMRMTHRNPADRFASMSEVLREINKIHLSQKNTNEPTATLTKRIENISAMVRELKQKHLSNSEIRQVLIAACELKEQNNTDPNKTMIPGEEQVSLNTNDVEQALKQLQASHNQAINYNLQSPLPTPSQPAHLPYFTWFVILSVMGLALLWRFRTENVQEQITQQASQTSSASREIKTNAFSPLAAPLPQYRLGTSYEYISLAQPTGGLTENSRLRQSVVEVVNSDVKWINNKGISFLQPSNIFLPPVGEVSLQTWGAVMIKAHAVGPDFFPLEVGKKGLFRVNFRPQKTLTAWTYEKECRVESFGDLPSKLGPFPGYVVRCSYENEKQKFVEQFWYAPKINFWVKYEEKIYVDEVLQKTTLKELISTNAL